MQEQLRDPASLLSFLNGGESVLEYFLEKARLPEEAASKAEELLFNLKQKKFELMERILGL